MTLMAYERVRTIAESPRATEHRLISEVSREMMSVWDRGARGAALMPALHRNREMWSTFAATCGTPGNALSSDVRASIISLALWVDRHTSSVMAGHETIEPLLEVNRSLLEGLSPAQLAA
jgi:flagellar biosynthesis activator protein FlaF